MPDTKYQSIDVWVAEQLTGYVPTTYPIEPLLLESNISRGFSVADRLFGRRSEISELILQSFILEQELIESDGTLPIQEELSQIQMDIDKKQNQEIKQYFDTAESNFSNAGHQLASGFAAQSKGTSQAANVQLEKQDRREELVKNHLQILKNKRTAVINFQKQKWSFANLRERIDRLSDLYLIDFKEVISICYAIDEGMRLLDFKFSIPLDLASPDVIWSIAKKIRLAAKLLEIEASFRTDQSIVIPLAADDPPRFSPHYPWAPDFISWPDKRLGCSYESWVSAIGNSRNIEFNITDTDHDNLIRPRLLSVGLQLGLVYGPQDNPGAHLTDDQRLRRDEGLALTGTIRAGFSLTPPNILGDTISRAPIVISNVGEAGDKSVIAGESGSKVECRSMVGTWGIQILPTITCKRGALKPGFLTRPKDRDIAANDDLRDGHVFLEMILLHVRFSGIAAGREKDLKRLLDDAATRLGAVSYE